MLLDVKHAALPISATTVKMTITPTLIMGNVSASIFSKNLILMGFANLALLLGVLHAMLEIIITATNASILRPLV